MKRLVAIVLGILMLTCCMSACAEDYSFLDGMTLDQLTALQAELETRIAVAKAEAGASDPTDTGMWRIKYYVDEFNNPTSQAYIAGTAVGTFSNSATTNNTLYVRWLIDKNDVAIVLYEYGSERVKSSYDATDYSIVMLDPDGKKVSMTGKMYKGGDRIFISSEEDKTKVLEAFKRNGSVSFRITEMGNYATSSYLFKMNDTSYFSNAYDQLE